MLLRESLKVEESSSLEFPPVESTMVESGDFEREINDLRGDIRNLQETIDGLQEETETDDGIGGVTIIVAIGLGIAGIIIGVASLVKKK